MEKTRHYSSLMLLPALLLCGSLAKADLCSSEANFAALEATGTTGCTIGDKTYNDFTFQSSATGGATALTAADVTFIVVNNGLIANGFDFTMSLDAGTTQTNDVLIGFDVSVTPGDSELIASSDLSMDGIFLGTGIASIAETNCVGAPLAGCPAGDVLSLSTSASSFGAVPADSASFTGVTELGVSKDINVSGGASGFASISGVDETVDQVSIATPEPASIVFFGTLLLGVTALIRKKQVKRS